MLTPEQPRRVELGQWGTCAFRGVSKMVLGLEGGEVAGEELDSRSRGSFWHDALARLIPELDATGCSASNDNLPWRSSSTGPSTRPEYGPASTRSSSGSHWWWTRGASVASARFSRWSITFDTSCSTVLMMRLPPGLPVTSTSRPSLSTRVGVIELSGRLPGPTALAAPPISP